MKDGRKWNPDIGVWGQKNCIFFPEKIFKRRNHCFLHILDKEVHSGREDIFSKVKEGPDGLIDEFYQTCKKDIV